jgi:hypothetical protein
MRLYGVCHMDRISFRNHDLCGRMDISARFAAQTGEIAAIFFRDPILCRSVKAWCVTLGCIYFIVQYLYFT